MIDLSINEEQQGKSLEELDTQWFGFPEFWEGIQSQSKDIDTLIERFNERTGLAAVADNDGIDL